MKFIVALSICLFASCGAAGKGVINFVETSVDLRPDGQAVVMYEVQYRVTSGVLHGFYFEEGGRLAINNFSPSSNAVDSSGNSYRLSIKKVAAKKWDIVLANGAGVSSGTVTYRFAFPTSFSNAGYLGLTTAADGRELTYFNWAPSQWDEAADQDHYTLKILTPYTLPAGADPRAEVDDKQLILTEKWVNDRYLIDYRRAENNRLQLVFHINNPGNRYQMRTQFYMPAAWFSLTAATSSRAGTSPTTTPTRNNFKQPDYKYQLYAGIVMVLGLFVSVAVGKQRSMISANQTADEADWGRIDWTPPRLELSTLQKKGKICKDLTPLQAALEEA